MQLDTFSNLLHVHVIQAKDLTKHNKSFIKFIIRLIAPEEHNAHHRGILFHNVSNHSWINLIYSTTKNSVTFITELTMCLHKMHKAYSSWSL